MVINELLKKITDVKNDGMEDYFLAKISKIRGREVRKTSKLFMLRALANTIIRLLPLLSVLLIVAIEILVLQNQFDVTQIFSILSIVTNFGAPLRSAIQIFDSYYDYKYAITSMD